VPGSFSAPAGPAGDLREEGPARHPARQSAQLPLSANSDARPGETRGPSGTSDRLDVSIALPEDSHGYANIGSFQPREGRSSGVENYCITCGKWRPIAASWMCGECLTRWRITVVQKVLIVTTEDLPGRWLNTPDPPGSGTAELLVASQHRT
jgi:hypothetical protein